MFENSVKIKLLHIPIFRHELIHQNRQSNWTWRVSYLILLRSFSISVNSGFRIINLAANIQLLFTLCSKNKCFVIAQCEVRNKISAVKQEKVCSTRLLVMSLRKILETFIGIFPSSFNRKYVHTVACTVVFVGTAGFVFNAYPGCNATRLLYIMLAFFRAF